MHENLFRGKQIYADEWVEGSLLVFPKTKRTKILVWEEADLDFNSLEVDPETVGRYTGKEDKNGKKIFEGDIVDASDAWWNANGPAGHDSPVMLVEWSEFFCGFEPFANYDCDCGVYIAGNECKVIGNIHDNPKLLENGDDSQPTD